MRRTLVLCLALSLPVALLASQPPAGTGARDAVAQKSGTAVIRGRVTDKDSGVPLEAFTVTLAIQTGDRAPAQNTRTNADGRFEMTTPPPSGAPRPDLTFELGGMFGAQTLTVRPLPVGWTVKEIRYNGADITDVATEFKSSPDPRPLEIVLTRRGAHITGRVLDDKVRRSRMVGSSSSPPTVSGGTGVPRRQRRRASRRAPSVLVRCARAST